MSAPPPGVPAFTFASISPALSPDTLEDVTVRDNYIVLDEPGKDKTKEYTCDEVFGSLVDPAAVLAGVFGVGDSDRPKPLASLVESSTSVCLCLLGPLSSAKTVMFQGGQGNIGAVGYAAEELFKSLEEKERVEGGDFRWTVEVSFFEMYDEIITDLLKPENKDLQVSFLSLLFVLAPSSPSSVSSLLSFPLLSLLSPSWSNVPICSLSF